MERASATRMIERFGTSVSPRPVIGSLGKRFNVFVSLSADMIISSQDQLGVMYSITVGLPIALRMFRLSQVLLSDVRLPEMRRPGMRARGAGIDHSQLPRSLVDYTSLHCTDTGSARGSMSS